MNYFQTQATAVAKFRHLAGMCGGLYPRVALCSSSVATAPLFWIGGAVKVLTIHNLRLFFCERNWLRAPRMPVPVLLFSAFERRVGDISCDPSRLCI